MHARRVELTRFLEGLLNRLLRDLVKYNAMVTTGITTDRFLQVPSNGLALSVQVSCEIDGIAGFSQLLELAHHFFFTRQNFVAGFPAVVWVDAHPAHQLLSLFLRLIARLFVGGHLAGDRSLSGTLFRVRRLCAT